MGEKTKVLIYGDGAVPTGFMKVLKGIFDFYPREEYDISWLAVNYMGDSHPDQQTYKLYPASSRGNLIGINRIVEVIQRENPDILFILNDVWVISMILREIKNAKLEKLPKIVTYFPIDSKYLSGDWFGEFDIVSECYTYTSFGKYEVDLVAPQVNCGIMYHGVDTNVFRQLTEDRREVRKIVYPQRDDFENGWIVFSGNRNQPRKHLDIALIGFSMFSENKPDTVKFHAHCGLRDAGISIIDVAARYGMQSRLIISNKSMGIQTVTEERLNFLYNATNVGINTSDSEGWGLCNFEHAVTGAVQVVSDHSSLHELFQDAGILVPATFPYTKTEVSTEGYLSTPDAVAERLEYLYQHPELEKELSKKSIEKFTRPEYQWQNISKQWQVVFDRVLGK